MKPNLAKSFDQLQLEYLAGEILSNKERYREDAYLNEQRAVDTLLRGCDAIENVSSSDPLHIAFAYTDSISNMLLSMIHIQQYNQKCFESYGEWKLGTPIASFSASVADNVATVMLGTDGVPLVLNDYYVLSIPILVDAKISWTAVNGSTITGLCEVINNSAVAATDGLKAGVRNLLIKCTDAGKCALVITAAVGAVTGITNTTDTKIRLYPIATGTKSGFAPQELKRIFTSPNPV